MEYIEKWKDNPVHKQKTSTGFKHIRERSAKKWEHERSRH